MSCTVYVKIPDAVYYITANTGKTLAVDGSLDDATPVKLVTKSDVSGHAKLRQLWKIRYVGNGCYGIRSLYKSDKVLGISGGTGRISSAGTADYVSSFDNFELWKIEQVGSSYVLQNCGTTTSKQCLKPMNSLAVSMTYTQGDGAFAWTLTPDTAVPDLMILIDADTCFPVNGSVKSVSLGESATLEDLNLIVSYISQHGNTTNYYWQVSDSSIASITGSNNKVSALARGEATISLHAGSSTNTPMYFTLHVPWVDDGVYYIRNWVSNKYLEASSSSVGESVCGEMFNGEDSQLWEITYLGNREYSIQSHDWHHRYIGIDSDSSEQGVEVVIRQGSLTAGMKWTFTQMESGGFRISAQCAPDLFLKTTAMSSDHSVKLYAPENPGFQFSEWLFCEYSNQIVPEIQEQSNLCWVTCARMASFKYMKSPINQGSAVQFVHGNHRVIPDEVDTMLNHTGVAQHTAEALEYILGWEGCAYYERYAVYSENVLVSLLDAGNVVIAERYEDPQKCGHSYLVYDYWYNSSTGRNEFYIYDPAAECGSSSLIRSYAWLCDGDNAYDSSHKDGRVWLAIVTYRIGMYEHTISDS